MRVLANEPQAQRVEEMSKEQTPKPCNRYANGHLHRDMERGSYPLSGLFRFCPYCGVSLNPSEEHKRLERERRAKN